MRRSSTLGAVKYLVLVLIVCGCFTSRPPQRFGPAITATGVTGSVRLIGGTELSGELLAVNDTAYVMLIGSRVTIARYATLSAARFGVVGQVTASPGEVPRADRRQQLGSYSRFPFGIPDSALAALLAKGGQTVVDSAVGTPR
jgi:hypothetical protein